VTTVNTVTQPQLQPQPQVQPQPVIQNRPLISINQQPIYKPLSQPIRQAAQIYQQPNNNYFRWPTSPTFGYQQPIITQPQPQQQIQQQGQAMISINKPGINLQYTNAVVQVQPQQVQPQQVQPQQVQPQQQVQQQVQQVQQPQQQ